MQRSRNARSEAGLLVFDTFGQFARFKNDEENVSGAILEALRPVQRASAEGLAIILVHHERKRGGDLSDSGRGSSALGGAVDSIVSVGKPKGQHPRNVRALKAVSRLSGTHPELLIELGDDGYRVLGTPEKLALEESSVNFLAEVPQQKKQAMSIAELMAKTCKSRVRVQRLLDKLVKDGKVVRLGKGKKGNAFRYFSLGAESD
jgi:hypothetical protein